MTTGDERTLPQAGDGLEQAVRAFAARINEDAKLRKMVADWDRRIALVATDDGSEAGFRIEAGVVSPLDVAPDPADVLLRADVATLTGVFRGELSPTEPYVDGTLLVQGSQEDVLRLDFLSLMIWGG